MAAVPVYFVEITSEDHKRWKDVDITNREKLARLVEAAYEKEADVIVLEVWHGMRPPIMPQTVSSLFQLFAILVGAAAFTRYPSARAISSRY